MQPDQQEQEPKVGRHAAQEGAETHPLINLDRDPTPGHPDHAADDDE